MGCKSTHLLSDGISQLESPAYFRPPIAHPNRALYRPESKPL
ncbi:Uncharacterised protein [Vibrio cholerae]|nr:Uncharacterised protein [Vibrio cholerae]